MEISQVTSAVMVFLTGLLPASCHKADAKKSPPPAITANATNANYRPITGNIGQISLTNHEETCVEFANGMRCTLTPKVLDRNNIRITVALESRNDYGDTKHFDLKDIVVQPGKPAEVAVGEMSLTFTPTIVEK